MSDGEDEGSDFSLGSPGAAKAPQQEEEEDFDLGPGGARTRSAASTASADGTQAGTGQPTSLRHLMCAPAGIGSGAEPSQLEFFYLPHPRTGTNALFAQLSDGNGPLLFVQRHRYPLRSWLLDQHVQQDGSLFVLTPVDPVFLALPRLFDRAANGGQLRSAGDLLEGQERLRRALPKGALRLVCDWREVDGEDYYIVRQPRVLAWLRLKVKALEKCEALDRRYSGGVSADAEEAILFLHQRHLAELRVALVGEFIPSGLLAELTESFGLDPGRVDPSTARAKRPKEEEDEENKMLGAKRPRREPDTEGGDKQKGTAKGATPLKGGTNLSKLEKVNKKGMASLANLWKAK
eukprot:TRINITY_DN67944_c0_g1_i1.p1 TRINITY_DN67944_c0_g1~~TRINITY_DN67944_c0_g1_i1.p1  ORF type:complete len:349 (+),score=70.74 TRINITY_DN67944_c0_g1_i1:107-1153(+)